MIDSNTLIRICILFLLGFSLWFGHRVSITVMSNLDKMGGNEKGKERVATRATTNFWIGFAAVIIIVAGLFSLITKELFIAFLTADLLGLGVKLTSEFIESGKN